MKTLKFIVMAMSAVALSMNFTACSSSDGNEKQEDKNVNNNYGQKYISIMKSNYVNSNSSNKTPIEQTYNASYDNNILTKIECTNSHIRGWDFDYKKLVFTCKYPSYFITYSFVVDNNNCITKISSSGEYSLFTYNENRQLTSSEYHYIGHYNENTYYADMKMTINYIWQNENLVKAEVISQSFYPSGNLDTSSSNSNTSSYIFEYGNIINKGKIQPQRFISMWPFNYSDDNSYNIVMSSGLFGELSKNLPKKVIRIFKNKDEEITTVTNYTYELDDQGFVKSISSDNNRYVYSEFTYKN